MSTPKYPSYKDVPIPWISSIPEQWDWKPVLGAACERDEDNKGMKEDNLLSLSYGNIVNKDINTSDGLLPESFETYQIVRPGDIVLRLTDLQNDKRSLRSALVTQTGIITSAYLALKPIGIDPKYLGYLLRAYDASKVFYSMGGGLRQSMKYGDIKRMPLVIPTKAEQCEITSFLDRETAKIDALIREQKRLIELLQEKRQAVISHAVTKGLNPNAPMKDSGVEWLGEVPEHWQVRKFAWDFASAMGQTILKEDLEEAGLPVFSATEDDRYFGHISNPRVYLHPGDIVIPARGNCIGAVKLVKEPASATQTTIYAKQISKKFYAEYIFYFLRFNREHLFPMTRTAIPQITVAEIASNRVCLPPGNEQRQIVDYVESVDRVFRGLISESRSGIDLLQERRSAMISAAVTGQIDVRGLAAEVAA